jgi:hypothetical protein
MNVPVGRIRLDGGTQPRAMIDQIVVADYAEAMREGASFPPVVVWFDGTDYWLSDGYHRVHAALTLGLDTITADVRTGTQQDAQWHSYGVNATHGLRRTNDDKRRAVEAALRHPNAATMSNRLIAAHCGVNKDTVRNYREADWRISPVTHRFGLDGRTINTANIGRTAEPQITHYAPIDPSPPRHEPVERPLYQAQPESATEEEDPIQQVIEERPTLAQIHVEPVRHAVHFSSATPEWYTPQTVVNGVLRVFGHIDLDPCSNAHGSDANVPARFHYTKNDNGLTLPWSVPLWVDDTGETSFATCVYMNPPYGDEIGEWVNKMIREYTSGNVTDCIALLPARVDTAWFQPLYDYMLCFIRGRLRFVGADNSAPFPSVLVYLGKDYTLFRDTFSAMGRVGVLK